MTIYYEETIRIRNAVTDFDGDPIAPDSQIIQIFKPDGTQSGADMVAPTPDVDLGSYYQDFDLPAAGPSGFWRAVWKVTIAAKNGYGIIEFQVISIAED